MSTSFQPDKPYEKSTGSSGLSSILVTGLLAALAVVMLFALAVPRFFMDGETNWLLTLGAGALTFIIILAIGMLRKSG